MRIQRSIFKKLERNKISALEKVENFLFMNFEHYNLTIYMVNVYKDWYTYGNTN